MLDGYEALGWRRVHLDGLDFGREAFDADAVMGGGVDDAYCGHAIRPGKMVPVVIVEVIAQRRAGGVAEVKLGPLYRNNLAGGEDVVVAIHLGHGGTRNQHPRLFPVA